MVNQDLNDTESHGIEWYKEFHKLPTKDTELQQKLITAKNKSYVCITIPKGNLQTVLAC